MTAALGHTPQRAVEEDVELLSDELDLPERRDLLVACPAHAPARVVRVPAAATPPPNWQREHHVRMDAQPESDGSRRQRTVRLDADAARLLRIFAEARAELSAQGYPLPLPPDPDDDESDRRFWDAVDRRFAQDANGGDQDQ